jgi:hypothetical protein
VRVGCAVFIAAGVCDVGGRKMRGAGESETVVARIDHKQNLKTSTAALAGTTA